MLQIYKLKFYGSCGHNEEEIISLDRFEKLSAERLSKTIFGNFLVKAEVSTENNTKNVHIIPERWCCCNVCMKEEFDRYEKTT